MSRPPLEILTPKEAAEQYNVPLETIRGWIKRKKIQPLRNGRGRIAIRRDEVERMLRFTPESSHS